MEYRILDTSIIERLIKDVSDLQKTLKTQNTEIEALKQRLREAENAIVGKKGDSNFLPGVKLDGNKQ